MPTDSTARPVVLRQRYTLWQQVRANMYGRLPLLLETLIALGLIAALFVVDSVFFLHHGSATLGDALVATLGLLALQVPNIGHGDQTTLTLLAFNLLFSLLFAQSVLNSLRALFTKRSFALQQQGLAAVLRGHLIICGLGRLQIRAAVRLVEEGYAVAIIQQDDDSPLLQRALALHIPVIYGNAVAAQTLRLAGIQHARAVLAIIDGDLIDVEIALAVRALRPNIRIILRAFSEDFDRGLEKVFGPNTAFSASALAAPTFAVAAVTRHVEQVVRLGDELLAVVPIAVPHGWDQAAKLEATQGIRILARLPGPAADRLFALAPLPALNRLPADATLPHNSLDAAYLTPTATHDRIIICGLGKIGYRMVTLLQQVQPRPHIVVMHLDDGEASFAEEIAQMEGVEVIAGDAHTESGLQQAGIARAITVAAVTADDQLNVQIGLAARRLHGDVHVVLRVFQRQLADSLADLFGIHTAFSTSDIASATLTAAALTPNVSQAFYVNERLFAVAEITAQAGDALAGRTVAEVRQGQQVHVLRRRRQDETLVLPDDATLIAAGDGVSITGPIGGVESFLRQQNRASPR